jgi:hypothetical protein
VILDSVSVACCTGVMPSTFNTLDLTVYSFTVFRVTGLQFSGLQFSHLRLLRSTTPHIAWHVFLSRNAFSEIGVQDRVMFSLAFLFARSAVMVCIEWAALRFLGSAKRSAVAAAAVFVRLGALSRGACPHVPRLHLVPF